MEWTPAVVRIDTAKEPPLSSPAEVRAPIDVLLTWHEDVGIPSDWDRTVARWPEPAPGLPPEVHHTRAVHDGVTVGVHVGSIRRDAQLHTLWCAVHPAWRGRGIAQRLVARHVAWAFADGRRVVRAHVRAAYRAMLIAGLKVGFDVIGSFTDADGDVILILERRG